MFGIKRRDSASPPPATGTVNLSAEDYGLLLGIYEQQLGTREDIMALTKQVQDLLDRSKQESDLIRSISTGMKALLQQNADLQSKIDQVPVAPAPAMSQEDKDALTELASDMDTAILTAQQAIPQNTPAQNSAGIGNTGNIGVASPAQGGSTPLPPPTTPPPSSPGTSNPTPGSPPSTSTPPVEGTATPADQSARQTSTPQADASAAASQHQSDADAASQAKPLAGTGGQ